MDDLKLIRVFQVVRKLKVSTDKLVEESLKFGRHMENNLFSKISIEHANWLKGKFSPGLPDFSLNAAAKKYDSIAISDENSLNYKKAKNLEGVKVLGKIDLSRKPTVNQKSEIISAKAGSLKGLSVLGKIKLPDRFEKRHHTPEVINENLTYSWPNQLEDLEIGKVKFFDARKKIGYVTPLSGEEDLFIDSKSLKDKDISSSELVLFDRKPSKMKKGKYEAVNVSSEIPSFLFTREGKNFVSPFVGDFSEEKFPVNTQLPNGVYIVKAKLIGFRWYSNILGELPIPDKKHKSWAKKIFYKQSENLVQNKASILWLIEFLLKSGFGKKEFQFYFASFIPQLEKKLLLEVKESVEILLKFPYLDDFFESLSIAELGKSSFWFWLYGLIPSLPKRNDEEEFWKNEILPNLNLGDFVQLLFQLQKQERDSQRVMFLLNEFLKKPIVLNSKQGVERFYEFINPFFEAFPKLVLKEDQFENATPEIFIELLDRKILRKLSHEKIKRIIESLESEDDQVSFIKKFQIEQALDYFGLVDSLRAKKHEYLIEVLESRISKLDLICFDLEIREGVIKEYAWISEGVLKSNTDYPDFSQGLRDLVFAIKTSDLIIGQNIKEFDLPYLLDLDQDYKERFVWDTLQVEMLLNPIRKSFGLMTSHSAAYDTKQTFQLFFNQVFRVVSSGVTYQRLKPFLPEQVIEPIERKIFPLGSKYGDKLFFDEESNKFFRPQDPSTFPKETLSKLEELLSTSRKRYYFSQNSCGSLFLSNLVYAWFQKTRTGLGYFQRSKSNQDRLMISFFMVYY